MFGEIASPPRTRAGARNDMDARKSSSGIRLASVSKPDEKMADSLKAEQYVSVVRASHIDPT